MIIGSNYIYFAEMPSTNVHAAELVKNSLPPEGSVIHTGFQSSGKGQAGNKWESEKDKNLLLTVILYPSMIEAGEQFIISMVISLGILDFFRKYLPASACTIKWPNDIYVNDDKIAGILIENSIIGSKIESSVAGAGLNINQELFLSDAPNPTSLKILTGSDYDLNICLSQLTAGLDRRYKQLIAGDLDEIRSDYTMSLYGYKEWKRFRTKSGLLAGRIISVSHSGLLEIEDKSAGLHRFAFKEIEFMQR